MDEEQYCCSRFLHEIAVIIKRNKIYFFIPKIVFNTPQRYNAKNSSQWKIRLRRKNTAIRLFRNKLNFVYTIAMRSAGFCKKIAAAFNL
ncbi:hypothetical protein SDC9_56148 [bioreactor metagenome]|uniref:Uncharacterized protein n=1 Tax=bioreactor metagenome TaxID=1076179 RepID=A0A644X0Y9_9ZZZZ